MSTASQLKRNNDSTMKFTVDSSVILNPQRRKEGLGGEGDDFSLQPWHRTGRTGGWFQWNSQLQLNSSLGCHLQPPILTPDLKQESLSLCCSTEMPDLTTRPLASMELLRPGEPKLGCPGLPHTAFISLQEQSNQGKAQFKTLYTTIH